MTASLVVAAISAEATLLASRRLGPLLRGSRCGEAVRESLRELTLRSAGALCARRKTSLLGFTSLLEAAARESGRAQLGLEMAAVELPHDASIMSELLKHAPTVGQALEDLARFFALIQTGTTVALARERGLARFVYGIADPSIADCLQDAAYTLGKICRSLQAATGQTCAPERVTLALRAPASAQALQAYPRFFRAPVIFGAQSTALCFPESLLALPIRSADAARYGRFCASLRRALPAGEEPGPLEDALRAWLAHAPPGREATLAQAAADFGATPRTLQRRLRELGSSFLGLRAQQRMKAARHLLAEGRLPLARIAEQLGFSEPSAFTRAFHAHAQQSPRSFRQTAQTLVR